MRWIPVTLVLGLLIGATFTAYGDDAPTSQPAKPHGKNGGGKGQGQGQARPRNVLGALKSLQVSSDVSDQIKAIDQKAKDDIKAISDKEIADVSAILPADQLAAFDKAMGLPPPPAPTTDATTAPATDPTSAPAAQ